MTFTRHCHRQVVCMSFHVTHINAPGGCFLFMRIISVFSSVFYFLLAFFFFQQHGSTVTIMMLSFFRFFRFCWDAELLLSRISIFQQFLPAVFLSSTSHAFRLSLCLSLPSRFGILLARLSTRSDSSFHHTPSLFLNSKPLRNKVCMCVSPVGFHSVVFVCFPVLTDVSAVNIEAVSFLTQACRHFVSLYNTVLYLCAGVYVCVSA